MASQQTCQQINGQLFAEKLWQTVAQLIFLVNAQPKTNSSASKNNFIHIYSEPIFGLDKPVAVEYPYSDHLNTST
jgi:hypothetical protein